MSDNPYRKLPAVNDILAVVELVPLAERHGHEAVVGAVRAELEEMRARLKQGQSPNGANTLDAVAGRVAQRLTQAHRPKLVEVINATGIVLHTNLGRAPVAEEAARAASSAAAGYL